MLKIQSVNHVSEHLSAIYPVYTLMEVSQYLYPSEDAFT